MGGCVVGGLSVRGVGVESELNRCSVLEGKRKGELELR